MQSTTNVEINYLHVMSIFIPKASGKSDEALYLEQKLSRVILNLGTCMFSEVICTQFMEDAYLPCVVCTVFDFPHWVTRHCSRSVLTFMKLKRCCISVVSAVPQLTGIQMKTMLKVIFLIKEIDNHLGCYHSLCSTSWGLLKQPIYTRYNG